jgi:predicted double-glycine peptidase
MQMILPSPWVPWFETAGSLLLVALGVLLGRWFSRLPGRWWVIGYFLPLTVVGMIALTRQVPQLYFVPPFSWLTAGRNTYVLAGLVATCLLTTPLSRLPRRQTQAVVAIFMALIVFCSSVICFLAPALVRTELGALVTKVDKDGVCLQSNGYNCGPASAVTAMRRLGLPAEEGVLAILAHTSPFTGTPPDVLEQTLNKIYGAQGVRAKFQYFKTLDEMRGHAGVLVVIKYGTLVDHYVALIEVNDREVVVGDPLSGIMKHERAEFEKQWRSCGVVLERAGK